MARTATSWSFFAEGSNAIANMDATDGGTGAGAIAAAITNSGGGHGWAVQLDGNAVDVAASGRGPSEAGRCWVEGGAPVVVSLWSGGARAGPAGQWCSSRLAAKIIG